MDLIEIDSLRLEAAEACFNFLANRLRGKAVSDVALFVPHEAALREDVRPIAARDLSQRSTDHRFRVAEAVRGCGVDPVDAAVDSAVNRGNRLIVVLRAPTEPPLAANRPGAKTDGGDVERGISERALLHLNLWKERGDLFFMRVHARRHPRRYVGRDRHQVVLG